MLSSYEHTLLFYRQKYLCLRSATLTSPELFELVSYCYLEQFMNTCYYFLENKVSTVPLTRRVN